MTAGRMVAQRLLWTIPLLLVVSFLVFGMVYVAPGDPARIIAGEQADAATVALLAARLGLDQPLHVQYGRFLGRLVQGDLGRSINTRRPVADELMTRFGATAKLAFASMVFAVVFGLALGALAAVRPHSWLDYLSSLISVLGISLPAFWLALMLMYLFSLQLQWLPTAGYGSWAHYVLPAITLGSRSLAVIARLTRAEMLSSLAEDYVRTAKAKGLNQLTVVVKHALRIALVPVVTVIGVQMGQLLAGSVVVEVIFNWPGLGRQLILAILGRDFPVVQGGILLIAFTFVFINLLVDLSYRLLDPRVRY